jgi:hypothetical protein
MSQSEINDVVAAVEALVRRAYSLGRRDSLRNLVKYAQSDEALAKPLALMAPVAEASAFQEEAARKATANDPGAPIIATDQSVAEPVTPAEEAPRYSSARPASGGFGAMILDFVYPPKAS